jgi:hypothetical protein
VHQNKLQYLSVSFRSGHLFYHPGRIAQENSASVHKDGRRLCYTFKKVSSCLKGAPALMNQSAASQPSRKKAVFSLLTAFAAAPTFAAEEAASPIAANFTMASNYFYRGLTQTDRYGRIIPKAAHGTIRFDAPTNLGSTLINESAKLFERITDPALTVRRITINANKVTPDEGIYQVDFFTDTKKLEREKKLQQAMLGIKNKYGKNAVLKASSYEEGATMRQRNAQIGGHSAGDSAGGSDGKLQK